MGNNLDSLKRDFFKCDHDRSLKFHAGELENDVQASIRALRSESLHCCNFISIIIEDRLFRLFIHECRRYKVLFSYKKILVVHDILHFDILCRIDNIRLCDFI